MKILPRPRRPRNASSHRHGCGARHPQPGHGDSGVASVREAATDARRPPPSLCFVRPWHQVAVDILDILIVTYVVYRALLVLRGTRAMQMGTGLGIVFLVYVVSKWAGLVTLFNLLSTLLSSIILIVIVVFQNDIRRGLMRVGQRAFFGGMGRAQESRVIDEVVAAATELARHRMGALICFEQDANLDEFVEMRARARRSTRQVQRELLVSMFVPESLNKLHDGAVIIRNLRIAKAGVFFPMPDTKIADKSLGSRHRAALGITEETDAVVVVVSEERGTISFCFNGNIVPNLDGASLKQALLGLFGQRGRAKKADVPRKRNSLTQNTGSFRITLPPPSPAGNTGRFDVRPSMVDDGESVPAPAVARVTEPGVTRPMQPSLSIETPIPMPSSIPSRRRAKAANSRMWEAIWSAFAARSPKNLNLKIPSFACALFIYSLVHGGQDARRSIVVDLEVSLPPESSDRVLVGSLPQSVRIFVRGSTQTIDNLRASSVSVQLDLASTQPSHVALDPKMVRLPEGVIAEVEQFDPPSLDLRWEQRVVRDVPMEVSVVGAPADGFVVKGALVVEPKTAKVHGPQSEVMVLQHVRADAFDVRGLTEGTYPRQLAVERLSQRLTVDPTSVIVTAEIAREVSERVFQKIPVAVVGPGKGKTQPAEVDVRLVCPPDIVRSLRPEQIVPQVEVTSKEGVRKPIDPSASADRKVRRLRDSSRRHRAVVSASFTWVCNPCSRSRSLRRSLGISRFRLCPRANSVSTSIQLEPVSSQGSFFTHVKRR